MSERQTFIDLCTARTVQPDAIDDFIDRWHEAPAGQELHDFLGMTNEEYALWLRVPDLLPQIISARRSGKQLDEVVAQTYRRLGDWLSATHKVA